MAKLTCTISKSREGDYMADLDDTTRRWCRTPSFHRWGPTPEEAKDALRRAVEEWSHRKDTVE